MKNMKNILREWNSVWTLVVVQICGKIIGP